MWVEFGEALALGVDFEAVGVTCGKTPGVDILTIVAGFTVISVVVFGSTEGFAVLCISLVWLETTLMVWLVFSEWPLQETTTLLSIQLHTKTAFRPRKVTLLLC